MWRCGHGAATTSQEWIMWNDNSKWSDEDRGTREWKDSGSKADGRDMLENSNRNERLL